MYSRQVSTKIIGQVGGPGNTQVAPPLQVGRIMRTGTRTGNVTLSQWNSAALQD